MTQHWFGLRPSYLSRYRLTSEPAQGIKSNSVLSFHSFNGLQYLFFWRCECVGHNTITEKCRHKYGIGFTVVVDVCAIQLLLFGIEYFLRFSADINVINFPTPTGYDVLVFSNL